MQDFPYWIFLAGISWLGCLVRLLVGLGVGLAEGCVLVCVLVCVSVCVCVCLCVEESPARMGQKCRQGQPLKITTFGGHFQCPPRLFLSAKQGDTGFEMKNQRFLIFQGCPKIPRVGMLQLGIPRGLGSHNVSGNP